MISSVSTGLAPDLPTWQRNAPKTDDLTVRVGIPHRGGKLAFHAFNEGYPAMVSANAFWNPAVHQFQFPDATDLTELDYALDSAGFTAMMLWKRKGRQRGMAGVYPWTCAQFVELASLSGATWYSAPDMACEPELASNQAEVDYRVDATATLLEGTLRVCYAWQNALARSSDAQTVQNLIRIPTPVIQGWSASTYVRSLELTLEVWERWQPWVAPPTLIGVGSVCRRSLTDPQHGLFTILDRLERALPKGMRLHLFGVKGDALRELKMHDAVASVDTMAWDFGARVKAHRAGRSNTIAHRSAEMTRWITAALSRTRPSAGDQYRLSLAV
ncbi:deazapurine DNA modification protein DpdA family protein [Burkholderia sp. MR1-5-21]